MFTGWMRQAISIDVRLALPFPSRGGWRRRGRRGVRFMADPTERGHAQARTPLRATRLSVKPVGPSLLASFPVLVIHGRSGNREKTVVAPLPSRMFTPIVYAGRRHGLFLVGGRGASCRMRRPRRCRLGRTRQQPESMRATMSAPARANTSRASPIRNRRLPVWILFRCTRERRDGAGQPVRAVSRRSPVIRRRDEKAAWDGLARLGSGVNGERSPSGSGAPRWRRPGQDSASLARPAVWKGRCSPRPGTARSRCAYR